MRDKELTTTNNPTISRIGTSVANDYRRDYQLVAHLTPESHVLHRWHLLSLDAPTIAVLWTWFVAFHHHVEVPSTVFIAIFLAVWILYAGDRLLDFSRRQGTGELKERHFFHGRYKYAFSFVILCSALLLSGLLLTFAPTLLLSYLYLLGVVIAYFILVHLTPGSIPKELTVGIIFAIATFVPTSTQEGYSAELCAQCFLLASLCWLNCSLISSWEASSKTSRFPLARLEVLTAISLIFGLSYRPVSLDFVIACATSLAILLGLDLFHRHMGTLTLRIWADVALLTPIVFSVSPL